MIRTLRNIAILAFVAAVLALPAMAQRTRRPAPRPTPKPSPAKPAPANPVVAAAKQQVANQLANVNLFVDKLGPVAVAIENLDKEARTRPLKKETAAANEANKKKVIEAIRGLRTALSSLETDFRTKPQLTKYHPQIQGIGLLCGRSEDNAIAGQFVASKDPLRLVAQKLQDTMAVLP